MTTNAIKSTHGNIISSKLVIADKSNLDYHLLNEFGHWLKNTNIVTGLAYTPQRTKSEGTIRVRLNFRLKDNFEQHYSLIRGLISLYNPFLINEDTKTKSFSFLITTDKLEDIKYYLDNIFNWFQKELAYKARLKVIIRMESEHRKAIAHLLPQSESAQ